jgi:hypothetical protein
VSMGTSSLRFAAKLVCLAAGRSGKQASARPV